MTGWPIKQLGELCRVVVQRAPVGTTPYLEIGNVDPRTKDYVFSDKPAVTGALLAEAGDIIVSRVRPSRGAITLLHEKQLALSAAFTVLRPRNEIASKFLFYSLAWNNEFLVYLGRRSKGALYPTVPERDVIEFEVPVPPFPDQERIVRILDEAEALCRLRTQTDLRLAQAVPALFFSLFGDPTTNSMGLPTVKLGDIAKLERGRFTPRPRNDPAYFDGPYPFIQTGDISASGGLLSRWQQTLNDRGKAVSKEFPTGTIVFAIVGATIGATAILQIPVYCPDSIVGIQVEPKLAFTEYVEFVLRSRRPLLLAQAPDAARANLNLGILRDLQIPIAPLADQSRFVELLLEIRKLEVAQATSHERLDNLFRSLLQRAFQGEL